jgi:pimeloyl-ACP methyl ester carboxylesterase
MHNHVEQGKYVQANGLDIYYEEYGSGEPLLLIHGGFTSMNLWKAHIPIFSQHFRVIAPDTRGHGRTKNPLDSMSYRLLADDVVAFVTALGIEKSLLCGFSDGGQIAFELGMNYPGLFKAYVADGATYEWPEEQWEWLKRVGFESPGVVNFEQFENEAPGLIRLMREHEDAFQGAGYWKNYLTQISEMYVTPLNYTEEDLKKIGEPMLIMMADHDFAPVEQAVYLYRTLPKAELAIVPGSPHFFITSKVELFTSLTLDFLLRQGHHAD